MNAKEIKKQAKSIIQDAVSANDWFFEEKDCDDGEELSFESVFLGTVFSIMPSGKYYMPWACSNVSLCPRCKGSGKTSTGISCVLCEGCGSREAHEDEIMQEALEQEANEHDCWVECGEGDPCDLFLFRHKEDIEDE